jgi:acetoin utilization deacetylase AcuC-like enzyme
MSMLHVVHHPGYVVETAGTGTFPHDKYALVMRMLYESGVTMTVHSPEIMPRKWLEAVHDPAYVDEVIRCMVPTAKQRRIGFAIDERISRRSQLSPGGTWLAASWHCSTGLLQTPLAAAIMPWPIPARATVSSTTWRSPPTG